MRVRRGGGGRAKNLVAAVCTRGAAMYSQRSPAPLCSGEIDDTAAVRAITVTKPSPSGWERKFHYRKIIAGESTMGVRYVWPPRTTLVDF